METVYIVFWLQEFFSDFADDVEDDAFQSSTTVDDDGIPTVELPTQEMVDKASAWSASDNCVAFLNFYFLRYIVTYDAKKSGHNPEHLSFPWLVWDILAFVKRSKKFGNITQLLHVRAPTDFRQFIV